jgi:hypothetical protein
MDYLEGSFYGYNDGMVPYISELISSLHSFTVQKDFFENKKALLIR